jgi:hypothetical protein
MSKLVLRVVVSAFGAWYLCQPSATSAQSAGTPDDQTLPPPPAAPVAPAQVAPPAAAEPAQPTAPAAAEPARPTEPEPAEGHKKHKDKKHKDKGQKEHADDAQPTDHAEHDVPHAHDEPDAAESADADQTGGHAQQSFEGDPWGDEASNLIAGPISMRVLLQTRYDHTFAPDSANPRNGYALRENVLVRDGDGFSLQRFFFRIAADPSPLIGFKAILDFSKFRGSDISNVLKQAYATLRPFPKRLEFAAGVFKLPFSILELDAVAHYELGSLGSADDFIKNLGFGGRDVGAEVMFAPLAKPRWLRVLVGAFRGHAQDEHASPLGAIGTRLESKPIKGLRIGVDVVGMPYSADYKEPFATSNKDVLPNPPDPLYPREQRWAGGKAYSADITYSRHRFSVRGEGMLGDRVDVDQRYGARSFWAAWALASYRFPVGAIELMPAARLEYLDTDREHAGGLRRELTLGVNVLFSKTVRMLVDVTRTDVQHNTTVLEQPLPLPAYPYLELDNTRVIAQLQVEL